MVEGESPEAQLIRLDLGRCIGCYECVDICPQSSNTEFPVYERSGDGPPRVANPDNCIRCLSCETNCRAMALEVVVERDSRPVGPEEVKAENKCSRMF
jgi:NAD-dependent dihydropyrimidine dehydrogenase PreA subunit